MAKDWAKSYLPRTLYGRAALILLVPVVVLQLVVSVVFIQRHYSGVTEQMSRNVALELRYLLHIVDSADTPEAALAEISPVATPLAFVVGLPVAMPQRDRTRLIDLSGRALMGTLRSEVAELTHFDTTENRKVTVWIETRHGAMSAQFDRRRVSASNPHQLLVLMAFTGVLLTLISFVFLRNQLRPIKRLARVSEAFGKGQIEDYRISGATEVRAAGRAFLDMRRRIERQIEQRTMMLSGVSHDLRTPLTRLKLELSMQEQTDETKSMLRDVTDMERLVEEFLAFARGDSLDDPEEVDISTLIQQVAGTYQRGSDPVKVELDENFGQATLRPLAVGRALDNLIGNAVKYGSETLVSASLAPRRLTISVEDDGPGIPEADREEAMKPFTRLDAARNQDRGGGVGLGLAIAHDICRRHGGMLELSDSAKLGGLKASLILPL